MKKKVRADRSKVIILATLVLILLTAIFTSMGYAEPDNANVYKDAIEQAVKKALTDGFSRSYTINYFKVSFSELKIDDGNVEADLFVIMNITLKAKKVEELDYTKGMLKRAGLSDFNSESDVITDEVVMKANKGKLTNEQSARVSNELNSWLNILRGYIGLADDGNFFIKVTAEIHDNALVEDSITMLGENADGIYGPLERFFPGSPAEVQAAGAEAVQSVIDSTDFIDAREQGYSSSPDESHGSSLMKIFIFLLMGGIILVLGCSMKIIK